MKWFCIIHNISKRIGPFQKDLLRDLRQWRTLNVEIFNFIVINNTMVQSITVILTF